jgi:tetratricopeptide (TPR) repeat protein
MLGFNLAGMKFNMGDIKEAAQIANETVALDKKTGNAFHLYISSNALGYTYQILGEADKSEQCFKEASRISNQLNDFQTISGGYDFIGLSHFAKGDYAKAKEYLEKLDYTFKKAGDRSSRANASQNLIWTYIELGETERARNLISNVSRYASKEKNRNLLACMDALKGILLRHEKKWERSIENFEKSLHEFETLGARQWDPYGFARMVLCEYAEACLERREEGDVDKARNLLDQAQELFEKIGAKGDIERIKAKKKLFTV